MTEFSQLGLAEPLMRALDKSNFTEATPVQSEVIPAMLEGHDVCGVAQTGTGKTAAFVLPLLTHLLQFDGRPEPGTARVLVVAPTRELAGQIAQSFRMLGEFVRMSSVLVVGGVPAFPQLRSLRRGVDVIIATPGRLIDHMTSGAISLDHTTKLILDEADQMMDMGFLPAIREIVEKMPRERQSVLLSATMPAQIRKLAEDLLHEPKNVTLAAADNPVSRIDQRVVYVKAFERDEALVHLLQDSSVSKAIIFSRTKSGADRIEDMLREHKISCGAIHGDKGQSQRTRVLKQFRKDRTRILVATEVAARGIDIDNISHVINYDFPESVEAHTHRIGRTARAGREGVAISFCTPREREMLSEINRETKADMSIWNWSGSDQELTKLFDKFEEKPRFKKSASGGQQGGANKRKRFSKSGGGGASGNPPRKPDGFRGSKKPRSNGAKPGNRPAAKTGQGKSSSGGTYRKRSRPQAKVA